MEELNCENSWKAVVTCGGWMGWDEAGGSLAGDCGSGQRPGKDGIVHCSDDSHSQGLVSICV